MDLIGSLNQTLDPMEDMYDENYGDSFERPCEQIPDLDLVLGPYVHSVMCVLGLMGNLLMLLTLKCSKSETSSTQILLVNLAVADLLLALVLPLLVAMEMEAWPQGAGLGSVACKLLRGGYSVSLYVAALLLAAVSVDRYGAVVHARSRAHSRARLRLRKLTAALVWTCALTLSLPNFIYNERYTPQHHQREEQALQGGGAGLQPSHPPTLPPGPASPPDPAPPPGPVPLICDFKFGHAHTARSVKVLVPVLQMSVGFLLPLVVICFCYGAIVVTLLRGRGHRGRGFRRERAVRLVLMVVLVFVLCHAPFNLTLLLKTVTQFRTIDCESSKMIHSALSLAQTLALLHCVLNPLLYGFNSAPFRKRFCQLLDKLRPQRHLSFNSQSERTTQRHLSSSSQSERTTQRHLSSSSQ
uniref:G-protein coupled receptors family 1 profile domain-containing protein n=1 Tax=Knipowitschia caucasica TaxID=637954 RepID=A0AAV2K6X7_KNICA